MSPHKQRHVVTAVPANPKIIKAIAQQPKITVQSLFMIMGVACPESLQLLLQHACCANLLAVVVAGATCNSNASTALLQLSVT
jgi:hypothetical protein